MNTNLTGRRCVCCALALAAGAAGPALGQIYQRADGTPLSPAGGANPSTLLEAVAPTADGGYIAVGREGANYLHYARYNAAGLVVWSRFAPTNFAIEATSINPLAGGAAPTYVIAGEMADAFPWGTWTTIIDGNGNVVCPFREINGVGTNSPTSRSPVAVKVLDDQSYVVTGRSQAASTAPTYGRLTRFAPGCGGVMWSRVYQPVGGIPGLTGQCEITDVVEEPGDQTLLAVGSAAVANGAAVPFLLRVDRNTGATLLAHFYGVGDPNVNLRGDGLARSYDATGAVDGYVFDGRSTPMVVGGGSGPTSNYVVKVAPGLNLLWGETFQSFEPCHAGVVNFGSSTLLAGTQSDPNLPQRVWGTLINSGGGAVIWNWNYGLSIQRGNGVAITGATPGSPMGPIIVGVGGATAAPGGYLVKSLMTTGSSGGCQVNQPPPIHNGVDIPTQFVDAPVQNLRNLDMPITPETLQTLVVCGRTAPVCCTNDFDGDGAVGTDADIEAFFACLGGNCCPTCPPTADFNCDGAVGTDADIASFFSVLGGGPC
jgi:hypothetical protein